MAGGASGIESVQAAGGGRGVVQKWSRRHKSQARKNPKEFNFAWGFSVFVVPGDGIEPPTLSRYS